MNDRIISVTFPKCGTCIYAQPAKGAGHSTTEIECFGMPPTVMILGQSPPDALGRPGMIMDSFVPKLRADRAGCSLHKPKQDFATSGRS